MIKIGTRGSKLALWQAHHVQNQLNEIGQESELVIIKTKGDQIQHLSFDKIEGKGFFTKEIEDALLSSTIDVAVHSMKDLPTESPEGLVIGGLSYRENPEDVLILDKKAVDEDQVLKFKEGAIIGTSSARRKSQLLDYRPDVQIKDIRGNVPTRIGKLDTDDFDGIVLAAAGIARLQMELSNYRVVRLNAREMIPAPAQGVIAYQCRESDMPTRKVLNQIHHREVSACTNVERTVLKLLGGGCHMPLGVYCEQDAAGNYHVWASKADSWDAPLIRVRESSSTNHQLAERVVKQLKK